MTHPFDLLSGLLDDEISPDEAARVTSHLASCDECRTELSAVREARDLVRALPEVDAPIPLLPAARRTRRWIGAAASVAAGLLAVGLAFGPGAPAEPLDLDRLADRHTTRVVVDPGIATIRATAGDL